MFIFLLYKSLKWQLPSPQLSPLRKEERDDQLFGTFTFNPEKVRAAKGVLFVYPAFDKIIKAEWNKWEMQLQDVSGWLLLSLRCEIPTLCQLKVKVNSECWVLYTYLYIYISSTYVADFQMSTRSQLLGG